MQKMSEIKGNDAVRIKEIAKRFDNVFSESFEDIPMRASIWTEAGNDNLILIRVLASDIDGNFVAYNGQYQVDTEEFFCDRKMTKAFISKKHRTRAINSLLEFISSITDIKFSVNKVMLDLNVMRYYAVKIGKSEIEDGSVEIHICTYLNQAKDEYGLVDAKKVVGDELASF